MLVINSDMFKQNSIYNFIDTSINKLIANSPDIRMTKQYWLFYYIKDDYFINLYSLYNRDIDMDFFGFPQIKKNTRHAIEAFIDLCNLISDPEYMTVLKYCSKASSDAGEFDSYLYRGQFTIRSKFNIGKELYDNRFEPKFLDICRESNAYVHPNVFVEVINQDERDKKRKILSELLNVNLVLLTQSYLLILRYFNKSIQPYMGCYGCMDGTCTNCYNNCINRFKYIVDNALLLDMNPNFGNFR